MICRIVHKKVQNDGSRSNFQLLKAYEQKRIVRITGKMLPISQETLILNVILSVPVCLSPVL